tara:strand:+ start:136 stop:561 length:426 start_codon:yes stop_codon:yes gene_type:complete
MNKGGCETGRKEEPKGGCKVGKKKQFKVSNPGNPIIISEKKVFSQMMEHVGHNITHANQPSVGGFGEATLPDFNQYLLGKEANISRPLTEREKKLYRGVFDRELLSRDSEGGWEGGSTKEEMREYRQKYGQEIVGIDTKYM